MVTRREVGSADGHALYAVLTRGDASRFASPPPPTIDAFQRFIEAAPTCGRRLRVLRGRAAQLGLCADS